MKTAAQYKAKPSDLDRSLLTVIPEAPRVPQQGLPPGYDWQMMSEDAMFSNPNVIKKFPFSKLNALFVTLSLSEQLHSKKPIELRKLHHS